MSGCGSSSSSEGGKPSGSAANTGGVITAACSYKNANYNPIGASSALMLPAIQHCLEGLYELDYFTGESNAALAAGEPVKVSETEYEVAPEEAVQETLAAVWLDEVAETPVGAAGGVQEPPSVTAPVTTSANGCGPLGTLKERAVTV